MTPQEILALRMKYKLSQRKMAIKAGVAPLTWCQWENDHARPNRLNQQILNYLKERLNDPYAIKP
jgi:DNA-binding transcriptional regulator YiaG